ncbi:MAG: SDR family NAD(P)-dependent oxidoreductase [Alphaproteobacteria bacterium]|nr:SDR family NAD(P)-dependent oxidoreductase [Alphaproteobacteria bacterium]
MRFPLVAATVVAMGWSVAADAATVLITGSNRGIGLELARQYADLGWNVIATSRTPDDDIDLQTLASKHGNLRIEALDVSDHDQIEALAAKLTDTPIDVLMNNAGILGGEPDVQTIGNIDFQSMEQVYKTNAIGPMKMAEAFLEHVAASDQKKIAVITSGTASLTNVRPSPFYKALYLYRMSKTAINMGYRALSLEVAPQGISVGILAPGVVETRLLQQAGYGGMGMTTEDSVTGVIRNVENLGPETSGQYILHNGKTVPW